MKTSVKNFHKSKQKEAFYLTNSEKTSLLGHEHDSLGYPSYPVSENEEDVMLEDEPSTPQDTVTPEITSINVPAGLDLRAYTASEGFEWIDVVGSVKSKEDFEHFLVELSQKFNIHPAAIKDCLAPSHLPKIERLSDKLFLITRYCNGETKASDQGLAAQTVQTLTNKIAIFALDKYVISIHRCEVPFIAKLKRTWKSVEHQFSIDHFLNVFLDKILETYADSLQEISDIVDFYEQQLLLTTNSAIVEYLYRIKRRASIIKRLLALTREMVMKLNAERKANKGNPIADPFRQDLLDFVSSLYFRADDAHENINNLLNLHMSLAAYRTNELMKVLTTFSVFFTPLTFIAGVYGMNFETMPELQFKYSYPILLGAMALVAMSIYVWLRRKGWIHEDTSEPFLDIVPPKRRQVLSRPSSVIGMNTRTFGNLN